MLVEAELIVPADCPLFHTYCFLKHSRLFFYSAVVNKPLGVSSILPDLMSARPLTDR